MDANSTRSSAINVVAEQHAREVDSGERFEFGKNWTAFLSVLDDDRIQRAERSLSEMLQLDDLTGKTFLDIGSGSGLFSLAARRLGATVTSFDFDTNSVACTNELKKRFFADDDNWTIEQGSVLDEVFIAKLGEYEIVYSWGVLHHTGNMWAALENASRCVNEDGLLFIAIYNDTGSQSERWRRIKSAYCSLPSFLKTPFAIAVSAPSEIKRFLGFVFRGKPIGYFSEWKSYRNARGMNRWYDIIDWVGGFPYEYAGPSSLFTFFRERGFTLVNMKCDNVGLGCNEMVFRKDL